MIRRQTDETYRRLRQQNHPSCVVCGDGVRHGLAMDFRTLRDGLVEATFACERAFEGYPEILHGGIICALLDGAMTNCLFASGFVAVTGDLRVRFRQPVAACGWAEVRAWIESSPRPLHKLSAEISQDGRIKAMATAKFLERARAVRLEQEREAR